MTPTKGRIVMYVMTDGPTRPAIVTEVFTPTLVNLTVFADGPNDAKNCPQGGDPYKDVVVRATSVNQNEDNHTAANTWHWPVKE